MEASDVIQAQISGQGLCASTILGEHRLEKSEIKWIEVEGETKCF